jgi:hypothetical protein
LGLDECEFFERVIIRGDNAAGEMDLRYDGMGKGEESCYGWWAALSDCTVKKYIYKQLRLVPASETEIDFARESGSEFGQLYNKLHISRSNLLISTHSPTANVPVSNDCLLIVNLSVPRSLAAPLCSGAS